MHRSPHPFIPLPCAASIGTAQYRDRRGCFLWGDRPATCGSSRTAASALGYAGPRPRCIESIDGSLEPSRLHSVCCSILRPTQFCKPARTPRRVRTSWEEGTIRLIVGYRASYSYGLAMVTHARKARPCSVCPPSFPPSPSPGRCERGRRDSLVTNGTDKVRTPPPAPRERPACRQGRRAANPRTQGPRPGITVQYPSRFASSEPCSSSRSSRSSIEKRPARLQLPMHIAAGGQILVNAHVVRSYTESHPVPPALLRTTSQTSP